MLAQKIVDKLKVCLDNPNRKITFLVGAGISAESGIPTFRGKDGYWTSGSVNYTPQEIGTFRMFNLASVLVWKWYLYRKSITEFALPNQSHFMLKAIEDLLGNQFALVSQNVDGLHRKAGSSEERTFLIHGDCDFVRCGDECSRELYPFPKEIDLKNRAKDSFTEREWKILKCPKCGEELRPHVLWFDEFYNEYYYKLDTVLNISKQTSLLFIIGTSGATNLPRRITENVLRKGGMIVDVNIADGYFSHILEGKDNGVIVQEKSSDFLTTLKEQIELLLSEKQKT